MIDDRVLVKVADTNEVETPSGILIPADDQEQANEGVVIAVGKGRPMQDGKLKPMLVKVGDLVWFVPQMCYQLDIDGVKHMAMRESDIITVVIDEEN